MFVAVMVPVSLALSWELKLASMRGDAPFAPAQAQQLVVSTAAIAKAKWAA